MVELYVRGRRIGSWAEAEAELVATLSQILQRPRTKEVIEYLLRVAVA